MSGFNPTQSYVEGGTARLAATLTDPAGTPVPPSSLRIIVMPPGSLVSYSMPVQTEGDACVAYVSLTDAGTWKYRFETTAPPYAASEGQFIVAARRVPDPGGPGGPTDPVLNNWRIEQLPAANPLGLSDLFAVNQGDNPALTYKVTMLGLVSYLNGALTFPSSYTLPIASGSVLGGIKVGTNLTIDGDGVLAAEAGAGYVLPAATDAVRGGIKVGSGLSIAGDVLSATYSYTLPQATASILGGVVVGDNINVSAGVISVVSDNIIDALGFTPPQYLAEMGDVLIASPTDGMMLRYNGSSGLWSQEDTPFIVSVAIGGTPTATQFLGGYYVTHDGSFPSNFSGSRWRCLTAPAASYAIDVKKNGSSVGTITFALGATTATFTTSGGSAVTVADGDRIEFYGAATPDTTIANIYGALKGKRT